MMLLLVLDWWGMGWAVDDEILGAGLRRNEAKGRDGCKIESAGVEVASFVAAGGVETVNVDLFRCKAKLRGLI